MKRALFFLVILMIFIWAVADAYQRRWVTDDIFIGFRYAQNLVDGRGLVYNTGERVEGYTNFLWVLIMAGGLLVGIKPEALSMAVGILSYALTLILLAGINLYESRRRIGVFLPIAFLGLAFHQHARIYATSGLETSFFTFLVTAATLSALFSSKSRQWFLTGVLASLAALTRPEGFLIYGLIFLFACLPSAARNKRMDLLVLAAPGAILLFPYLVWKLMYYKSLLPNTFYAKSANLSYWSQGIFYVYVYFRSYWPLLLGAVGIALLPLRSSLLFFSVTGLYLLYVVKVGGDFMFARFCLPVTPLLLIGLEFASYQIKRIQPFIAALTSVGMLFPVFPPGLGTQYERLQGIADEHWWYPLTFVMRSERIGNCLKEFTKNTETRVVVAGAQAALAYYAEFPVVIEGGGGITDPTIARIRLTKRGRIGHEKKISWEYIYSRQIHFGFRLNLPEPLTNPKQEIIDFGCIRGRIYIYKADLMRTLKARGARFYDFEMFLDSYIATLDQLTVDTVRKDYQRFKNYYFDYNDDPRREAPFLNKLQLTPLASNSSRTTN